MIVIKQIMEAEGKTQDDDTEELAKTLCVLDDAGIETELANPEYFAGHETVGKKTWLLSKWNKDDKETNRW